jgi:flagellar biosynthesis/type III secretory pathway protein FliH
MCKAIQEMYDDGVRDGIKQGIQKGVEQGREVKYTL